MKCWRRKKPRNWFLENGSKFLEKLIADCNGVSNPIRFFSSNQILKAMDPNCSWYKGVIEDRPYAIKEFAYSVSPGEDLQRMVYNDIVLSIRVSNHCGFLKLIGCCLELPSPVLVFENPENGVLNARGSVGNEDSPLLPWNVRLKISKQVAIAITYLHTAFPRIIVHRDINPSNVFLDKNWNAKLCGFAISVTLPEGKTWIKDIVTGIIGYLDPIYHSTGLVSEYTDVFSFGIFMLNLLMGRPVFFDGVNGVHWYILDYVKDLRERGETVEFGYSSDDVRSGQMNMFLELALRCCEERNEDRPKMILVAKEIKLIEKPLDC